MTRHRRLAQLLFMGYACILLTLTHLPPRNMESIPFQFWDKGEHAIAYFVLGALAMWASISRATRSVTRHLFACIALLWGFGALDEWTQPWFGRACELSDWLADSIGVTVGTSLIWMLGRRATRRAEVDTIAEIPSPPSVVPIARK